MAAYRREVDTIAGHFQGYQVEHIDRRKNEAADALSRLGSQRKPVPPNTFLDVLYNPSVKLPTEEDLAVPDPEARLVAALHIIPDWTMPYLAYMTRGDLPEDETLARQITRRSKSMMLSMVSCIAAVLRERFSVVSPLRKVKRSCVRSMKGIVAIMPAQSPLWPRLFVMVFIG